MSEATSNRMLSWEREGHVVWATLSNPPSHTLTAGGVRELHALLDELERERAVRVLVLGGAGQGFFVRHYEVGELASASESLVGARDASMETSAAAELHPFHRLCLRLEALPAITLAALDGSAAGGGLELALACDFRLASDAEIFFGLPETSVGIIPGAGGTQRLARLLGTARALDLILHAELVGPARALELGLVHRVWPAARYRDELRAFAADLAARAPIALAEAKRAIQHGVQLPLEDGLRLEQACFERSMRTQDAAGAMRAYLEGRGYQWQGE